MNYKQKSEYGFGRMELLLTLGTCLLLALMALPTMARSKAQATRATCIDNLRQVGVGMRTWMMNHDDMPPWLVFTNLGGTSIFNTRAGLAWSEFLTFSNELANPRLLTCPNDAVKSANQAIDWGTGTGGLANPSNQNSSVSYSIGLHTRPETPMAILSSDRNFLNPPGESCAFSFMVNTVGHSLLSRGFDSSIHRNQGNLLLLDGRVVSTPNSSFSGVTAVGDSANLVQHLLVP